MTNHITIDGNLTADPELRFTQAGAAVASFTVAHTPRTKQNGEWVDGETVFLDCSVWRRYAENTAETLTKGCRVVVTGRLKARSFETRSGDKRTVLEVEADEVAVSLRSATARITRSGSAGAGVGAGAAVSAAPVEDDPWALNSKPALDDGAPF